MHVFSQNNYKIENGSKETFVIIPKSTKFVNVFFRERFPIYGSPCYHIVGYFRGGNFSQIGLFQVFAGEIFMHHQEHL